eukprot:symbB.v1.2.009639.t1/scaffold617.1/size180324/5
MHEIGDLNFGDHEIMEALQCLVHRHAENLADLLLHEGLRQSPLAMLRPTVAGYRQELLRSFALAIFSSIFIL